MTAADCTVKQFMRAWFDDYRGDMDDATFHNIHIEYVDISGLAKTHQLELESQRRHILSRIEWFKYKLFELRTWVTGFDNEILSVSKPFQESISLVKSKGHKLYYTGDKQEFLGMIARIESKEKKYKMELEEKEKEIDAFIKQSIGGETQTLVQSRRTFIQNINMLRREGNPVSQTETTVEELALMIRWHNEQIEQEEAKKENKKYGKSK
jgi:hypothetical protein